MDGESVVRSENKSASAKKEVLRDCTLFSGLEEATLDRLAGCAVARSYRDAQLLFRQGEKADGFYVVARGEVEVYRQAPNGRRQTLHAFTDGQVCGEVPLFEGGLYPANAIARGPVETLYMPGDVFLELAMDDPSILLEMLATLSRRLRRFADLIDDLSLKEVTARLAKYLLESSGGSDDFELDCDRGQLAARIGTIAETLSRSFRKLQKASLIEAAGKQIRILDRPALESLRDGK